MTDSLIGLRGRVTARVTDQVCGEVMVSVGQGTEPFFAYAAERDVEISPGTQVVIVDEAAGRTVYVTPN